MFGQRLRLARKRAGLSLRSLAEQMTPRVTAQAISKYEAGRMLPASAVLVALAGALQRFQHAPHLLVDQPAET